MYRVVHIPEDEAVLLNSREKAPYLICVEVLKAEVPRFVLCNFPVILIGSTMVPILAVLSALF